MGRYRHWRRRYYTSHTSQYDSLYTLVGEAANIVKNRFFSLDGAALKYVLDQYERQHGSGPRRYAQKIIPQWRSGQVQMSGAIAHRIFDLLPPLMPLEEKYHIAELLWNRYGARSKKYAYAGPECEPDVVLQAIKEHFHRQTVTHDLPEYVKQSFQWLAADDVKLKHQILNHFLDEQMRLAIEDVRLRVPVLLNELRADVERNIKHLSHIVKVGNHELEIVLDRSKTGLLFSDRPVTSAGIRSTESFAGCWYIIGFGMLWLLLSHGCASH